MRANWSGETRLGPAPSWEKSGSIIVVVIIKCLCRDLLCSLSPLLHILCDLAISHLKALPHGVLARHKPDSQQQLTWEQCPTHVLDRQRSAHHSLSTPVPQIENLTQLSIILSSIQAQDSQSVWAERMGTDHVLELKKNLAKSHIANPLINELVDDACRLDLLLDPPPGKE